MSHDNGNGVNWPWLRRIVPAGYQIATLTLTGTAPLLMNSSEYDRESETFRAYYMLGHKTRKSLDDDARLRELEWTLGIYLDDQIGPYIPGKNVHELLRQSATKWRKGEEIKRSLVVVDYRIPLLYDGPRTAAELWNDPRFRYVCMVANGGVNRGRVIRCRPKFDGWSLAVEVAYDPEDLDFDFLEVVVDRSKKFGLGDYRPIFGSFNPRLVAGELYKQPANGAAVKVRNDVEMATHQAFLQRIMAGAAA